MSTVPKRKLKSCITACSSRCADVKRRSKREDSVLTNLFEAADSGNVLAHPRITRGETRN